MFVLQTLAAGKREWPGNQEIKRVPAEILASHGTLGKSLNMLSFNVGTSPHLQNVDRASVPLQCQNGIHSTMGVLVLLPGAGLGGVGHL